MANRTSASALTLLPRFSRYTSGLAIAFGLITLTGWAFHIYRFKSIIAGQIDVKANAAICFVLVGLALWSAKEGDANRYKKALSRSLALTAGLVGLLSFLEYWRGWDLGIDQLLFRVSAEDIPGSVRPGLMSPIAAADFFLLGIAITLLDAKRHWSQRLQGVLVAVAAVVASFGVLDLVLDPNNTHTHIAPTTALVLFLFSFAVLCARTQWGLGALLTSSTEGARWLRRSIPGALAVLIAYSALLAKPILTTTHFTWLEATLIGISAAVLLMAFVGWTAVLLDRSEHQRKRLEQASNLPARQLDILMERFEESPAESGLRRWSIAGIAVGMVLATLGGFDSLHNLRQASENDDWVAHTHAVSTELTVTLAHVLDIEDGTRSFAATGDPGFLEPAHKARAAVDSDLGTLRSLTADNASQQARLEQLSTQISERIEAAESTISYRQRTGLIPPEEMFLLGKQRMDAVRSTITEMQAEESRLLEQRRKSQAILRERTVTISLITALLGVGMLALAGIIVLREIRRSSMMRAQILALNAELECRVAERTSELRESEQRLRIALEAANSGAWEWDLRTNQNVWSDGLWKLYGLEAHSCEPSYDAWRNILHPEDRAQAESIVKEAARKGHEINFEFRVQHPDGTIRWLLSRGSPLRDEAGKPVRFIGIVVDVTARKLAEEALRESEARLRLFIEHAPAALAMFDREMRYLQVSRRWLADYCINDRDVRGVSHYEIFPEIPQRWKEAHRRGLAGEIVREESDRFERGDGTVQWIRWEIRPWYETNGEVGGIVLFSEDITAAKQAEEALRRSEERLRALVSASSDVVYRMSPDWSEMHQLEGRGFIADTTAPIRDWIRVYIHPDDQPLVIRTIQTAIRNKSLFELEHRVRQTDGSLGWTLSRAVPRLDANSEIIEWIGMASNVTRRKLAEETLRESRARLDAALASMTDAVFISDAEGRFIEFNNSFATFHRFKSKAECAKTLAEYPNLLDVFMSSGELAPLDMWAVARALRGETATDAEYTLRRKDTGETWVGSYSFAPIRDKDRVIVGSWWPLAT